MYLKLFRGVPVKKNHPVYMFDCMQCIYMALPSGATENKFGNIETGEAGRRVICIFCPLFVSRLAHAPARPGGTTRKCLCHGDSPKQRRLSMRKQRKEAKSDSPKTKNTNNLKFNRISSQNMNGDEDCVKKVSA